MNKAYVGIAILIILPTIISSVLFYCKRKTNSGEMIKTALFYFILFYSGISLMKTILGEGEYTLLESFKENSSRTYLHYMIPTIIVCIGIPLVHCYLFSFLNSHLFFIREVFCSVFYCTHIINYLYTGKIVNANVFICWITLLAFGLSVLVNALKWKLSISYQRDTIRSKLKKSFPIFAFYAVSVLFFAPNQLYFHNIAEFHVWYGSFGTVLAAGTILFTLLSVIGCIFCLSDSVVNYFLGFIFGLTLCGYLQENFLNGSLLQLDGVHQKWSMQTITCNLLIWIVALTAIFILLYRFSNKMIKIICYVSVYITAIQLVSCGYLAFTADWNKSDDYVLTTDEMLDLNEEDNVVVFILDWYDEQILEKIVEKDSDFLQPLQGFTWYKNQTSRYSFTNMSLPYLLTGTEWKKGTTEEEYVQYAYKNSDFLQKIKNQGYEIGIYTEPQFVDNQENVIDNYIDQNHRKCKWNQTLDLMKKCSQYQMSPFILKQVYWYETTSLKKIASDGNVFYGDNIEFYNTLVTKGLHTEAEGKGTYRFYHLYGVHDMIMTEDITLGETDTFSEGRGVMKIVYEYINQMKELGIYDSSTIIITADHGQNYFNMPERLKERELQMTSNPILLVKEKDAVDNLQVSNAPVSHAEFFSTVWNAVGIKDTRYGRAYEDVMENEDIIRDMIYYRTSDIPYEKYLIHGQATDLNSWSIAEE